MELCTSFLGSNLNFVASPAPKSRNALRSQPASRVVKTSCNFPDRQQDDQFRPNNLAPRRHWIFLAHGILAGAGLSFIVPLDHALAGTEKVTLYTNIEDARNAGEKLREEKEAAEGPVRVSSSGIKYRELEPGTGRVVAPGDIVSVYYTVSRLNGYYLDSMGYGKEGKNDVGEALKFEYGKGVVPEAIDGGMEGMREGGRRRILVTPERGWVREELLPRPTSFFAERRLSSRVTSQALLIEIELVKVKPNVG
ncbi:hypothetical protein R1sor_024008 [Riccia sorocarpa]|uniref:peptidylprolyl isomerase n=1 Tax=Riccia sorocarpa TaxID=122646 RepID=A0ABD3GSA8_9MARC